MRPNGSRDAGPAARRAWKSPTLTVVAVRAEAKSPGRGAIAAAAAGGARPASSALPSRWRFPSPPVLIRRGATASDSVVRVNPGGLR